MRHNVQRYIPTACIAAAIFIISTSGVLLAEEKAADQTLRVGVILPLTGEGAGLGKSIKQGIEFAYGKLTEAEKQQVFLYFEDNRWSLSDSVSAYNKLLHSEKINILMSIGSSVCNALSPLAEQKAIPFIAIGCSDKNIVTGRRYAFLHWVTPEAEAKVLAKEIRTKDYRRLAFITAEQAGFVAIRNAIMAQLREEKLTDRVVLDEQYLPVDRTFRTFIAKARSKKVDGVVVSLLPGGIASFAKQVKAAGLGVDLIGVELFEDDSAVKASGGALIGQWYVTSDTALPEFDEEYRQQFGEQATFAAANAFDSLNLVVEAFRKYGSDGAKIADYLGKVKDYRGAAGLYSATGDHRFSLPATVKVVTKDGFKKLY